MTGNQTSKVVSTATKRPFALIATPREGDQLAEFVERYAHAVCDRVLPALNLTETECNELRKEDEKLRALEIASASDTLDANAWLDSGEDSESWEGFGAFDYAKMEMGALYNHMLGLAFAGLFHIFERHLLVTLYRLNYRRGGDVWGTKTPKRWSFDKYKVALEVGGYPITGEIGTYVERLRLIANAMKHASPHATQELGDAFPELFWAGDANRGLDSLQLTPDLLRESAAALARFWREFPHE